MYVRFLKYKKRIDFFLNYTLALFLNKSEMSEYIYQLIYTKRQNTSNDNIALKSCKILYKKFQKIRFLNLL